jgi:hypothetical protein
LRRFARFNAPGCDRFSGCPDGSKPPLPGRQLPFTCFAGTQVEEIDITFADGLTLPLTIDGRRIETKSFVYTAGTGSKTTPSMAFSAATYHGVFALQLLLTPT